MADEKLEKSIPEYIYYYNNRRYQKRLKCMSPLEYRYYLFNNIA
ncbi:IS3 family transposase [Clostridium sp. D2Q-14]|nr:IS3 family transposase [Anaeromonas gelatinilytica]